VLKTCLYAGKDLEAYDVLDEDGKTVTVNTAAYGYENTINSIVATLKELDAVPSDLVLVREGYNSKARRLMLDRQYKATRGTKVPAMYEEFNNLLEKVISALSKVGAITVQQDGVEADDVIAWIARESEDDLCIVSNDGDLAALIGTNAYGSKVIMRRMAGILRDNPYGNFSPVNITIYKATVGDSSDNIKGVPGFGAKAFEKLLAQFGDDGLTELRRLAEAGNLSELYAQAEEDPLIKKLVHGELEFLKSYQVAKLHPEWVNTLQQPLQWKPGLVTGTTGDERLRRWESKTRLVTAGNWEVFKSWARPLIGDWLALDIETSTPDESDDWLLAQEDEKGVDVIGSELTGMSLTFGPNMQFTVYIPVDHRDTDNVDKVALRDFIASLDSKTKVIHNTQFEGTVLFHEWGEAWKSNGSEGFLPNWLDTKFEASYVDENNSLGLKKLAKQWFGYDQVDYNTVTTLEGAPGTLSGGRNLGEFQKLVKEVVLRTATLDDVNAALADVSHPTYASVEELDQARADSDASDLEFGLAESWPISMDIGDAIVVEPAEFEMVERRQYKMRELSAQHVLSYACDDTIVTACFHNFAEFFMKLEHTWKVYKSVEIDASYLHTQSFVQGVPVDLAKLEELRQLDAETHAQAWASLRTYLISKGWDGSHPPAYDGEPTPKQIKEAYTIVTGEELTTSVRKLERLAEAIAPSSMLMAELIRNEDWAGFKQLVDQHFTGEPVFNPGSPKQMQRLFYEVMGLRQQVFNAPTAVMKAKGVRQGTPQTNELAIKYAMQEAGPEEAAALDAIRLMKMVQTRRGLYYDTYPYFVHWKTGLLHSSHNQCATNTRRASSSKPNVQQLPKHAKIEGQAARFREVITPHKRNAVVVSMDFSSQEILLLAEWSHDPALEAAFVGEVLLDIHSKTGVGIWNRTHPLMSYEEFRATLEDKKDANHKEIKRHRALGKTIVFSGQYRASAKKIASVLMVTEDEAQAMIEAKAEAFPVAEEWALSEMERVKETGVSKTMLGAVRHLGPAIMSDDKQEAGKAERQTLSFRIQGSAAEMTKQAEGEIWAQRLVQKYDCRIYFPVHDEVVASVTLDHLEDFLQDMHRCMVRPYAGMRLPIRSSVSFGPSFGVQFECNNVGTPTREEIAKALAEMQAA
jgi:5'-3' exonuclease